MIFHETGLAGAFLIEPVPIEDERGSFARTFCREEFQAHGLDFDVVQCSISYNRHEGTLRGLHYQKTPHQEAKLVQCLRGAIYDVIVDLRPNSPTFARWRATALSGDNRSLLYIPRGFAHGFQTLASDTEVQYQMSEFYKPTSAAGIRWNDSRLGITWPRSEPILSARDKGLPFFDEAALAVPL